MSRIPAVSPLGIPLKISLRAQVRGVTRLPSTHSRSPAGPGVARTPTSHDGRTAPAAPGGTRPPATPVLPVPSGCDGRLEPTQPRTHTGDIRPPEAPPGPFHRPSVDGHRRTNRFAFDAGHDGSTRSTSCTARSARCRRPPRSKPSKSPDRGSRKGWARQPPGLPEFLGMTPIMFIMLSSSRIREPSDGVPRTMRSSGTGLGAARPQPILPGRERRIAGELGEPAKRAKWFGSCVSSARDVHVGPWSSGRRQCPAPLHPENVVEASAALYGGGGRSVVQTGDHLAPRSSR